MILGCEEAQEALRVGDDSPALRQHLERCTTCRSVAEGTLITGDPTEKRPPAMLPRPLRDRLPWLIAAGLTPLILLLSLLVYRRSHDPAADPPAASIRSPGPLAAAAPTPSVTPLAAPATRTLRVEATPPAQLTVDGRPAGTTPVALALAPGKHEIEARAEGFRVGRRTITVEPGTIGQADPAPLSLLLEKRPATARETAGDPAGATPGGGEPAAKAAGERAPRKGEEAEGESFAPLADRAAPDPEKGPPPSSPVRAAPPVAAGFGYLTITTDPWAKVILDGKDIGRTTPLHRFTAAAGHHSIELRARTGSVTVEADVKPREELEIEKTIE